MKPQEMTLAAVMSALVFIATFVPKIPIPLGYAHLGDAAIFLAVIFCGRRIGIISAVVGSALADILSGFPIWVVPTIIIKAAMAESFVKLQRQNFLIAIITASLIMTAGYTIFGAILYNSLAAGLASTPGLLLKSIVNIVITVVLSAALKGRLKKK